MPALNYILRIWEKILGEVSDLLPELQGALSLLEKVIRETQCVCTGTACDMRGPQERESERRGQ